MQSLHIAFAERVRFIVLSLAAVVVAAGCASRTPPPLTPPPANVAVDHRAGDALGGSTAKIPAVDRETAMAVSLKVLALDAYPADLLNDPGPDVRLISAVAGSPPVLASNRLTAACRWAVGQKAIDLESQLAPGAAIRTSEMYTGDLAIPAGTSARVNIAPEAPTAGAPTSAKPSPTQRWQLILFAEPSTDNPKLQIAMGMSSIDPATGISRGELALLNPVTIVRETPIAVLMPARFQGHDTRSVLAVLKVSAGVRTPEQIAALSQAESELQSGPATQPIVPTLAVTDRPQFIEAFAGMQNPANRRASLLYATGETNATICQDVALVANDNAVATLVDGIFVHMESNRSETSEQLGWAFDASALSYLSRLQDENKLSPELLAVMIRHTGQAAQNTGSVAELLRVSGSRADFDARVTAENFIYLEDNSPAARVRAFDWLSVHGKAPENYDPLGDPKQRRAAVEAAMDAMTAAAEKSPSPAAPGGKP